MPQPATHYLVVRRSIPEKHWDGWWDKYKCYFGLGSSTPDLFYFPCFETIGLVKDIRKDISWESLADMFHASKSYDFFCALLDNAKAQKNNKDIDANKLMAFSFGYYCHVVTDCIFHPYVYRSTGDHWNTKHSAANINSPEYGHKIQETALDDGISKKFYDIKKNKKRIDWQCHEGNSALLDLHIAALLHKSLSEVYPDCYPTKEEPDFRDTTHPIQQAYSALSQVIDALFEGKKIALFGLLKIETAKKILKTCSSNFEKINFSSPYPSCPSLPQHTPEELYNFACTASRKIFNTTLAFWDDEKNSSAKDFFAQNQTNYLGAGNWNLDTGLPCEYNNYKDMREEKPKHYLFKVEELKGIYQNLQSQYNPNDFT